MCHVLEIFTRAARSALACHGYCLCELLEVLPCRARVAQARGLSCPGLILARYTGLTCGDSGCLCCLEKLSCDTCGSAARRLARLVLVLPGNACVTSHLTSLGLVSPCDTELACSDGRCARCVLEEFSWSASHTFARRLPGLVLVLARRAALALCLARFGLVAAGRTGPAFIAAAATSSTAA